ncbi:MAG: DNA-binding protein, partial [Anaerolineales bacterium]
MDTSGHRSLVVDQAASMLGVSTRTVKRWLDAGTLDGVKIGRRWAITEASVRATLHGSPKVEATPRDSWWALWSYERLVYTQIHVSFSGIYRRADEFLAICSAGPNGASIESGTLGGWLRQNKAIGSRISIVKSVPNGAERIDERTLDELWVLRGEPLTVRDFEIMVMVRAPADIDVRGVYDSPPSVLVARVGASTPDAQKNALKALMLEIFPWMSAKVEVVGDEAKAPPFRSTKSQGDLHLLPSRRASHAPAVLKRAWEADEDYWVGQRRLISLANDPTTVLPKSFTNTKSRCLVNSAVFTPPNLRTLLCIHRVV